jgi:hypothetical protein
MFPLGSLAGKLFKLRYLPVRRSASRSHRVPSHLNIRRAGATNTTSHTAYQVQPLQRHSVVTPPRRLKFNSKFMQTLRWHHVTLCKIYVQISCKTLMPDFAKNYKTMIFTVVSASRMPHSRHPIFIAVSLHNYATWHSGIVQIHGTPSGQRPGTLSL